MSDQYIGEIRMFAGNFAPTGWALCNGQLLPISQNTALFSLLGTSYGGDGKSTFALPNLQDSSPMHQGQGPGLTDRFVGETAGSSSVTLIESEIPSHSHTVSGSSNDTNAQSPANAAPGASEGTPLYRGDQNTAMHPNALAVAGGSQPHNNRQPFLTVTFIIALGGIFPPRS
ncbi:MAG TPA: tail fiber protein [Ilumatobacteraceae bacterium]